MARLFNKCWRVTISRPAAGRFFQTQSEVTTITELRVTFDVEKNLNSDPNTCELSIYNMGQASRAELERKPVHVALEVGYDRNLELLFAGDVRWAKSLINGTEWETRIQLGDGERAYRHARVNRSFRGGVTVADAVRDVATTMELTLDQTTKDALAEIPHVNGLSLSGPSYRELTRLLSPHGLTWSIQDGRLQVLSETQTKGGTALRIAQDTGLIGSPEWGTPDDEGNPPHLEVKMLLKPSVYAGRLISIESRQVKGLFKPKKVRSRGDTHGDEWSTEIEAVAA